MSEALPPEKDSEGSMDKEAEVFDEVSSSEQVDNKYQQALDQSFERMQLDSDPRKSEGTPDGRILGEEDRADDGPPPEDPDKDNPKRKMLKSWLNNMFRIKMTDGRVLIGIFVCTDADANVVMQVTSECPEIGGEERFLGLVMIPGRYIVSIEDRNDAGKFAW